MIFANDVAVARVMSGEMSTDRMLIRQRLLVVRGHVQRDEQQLDQVSRRPRATSGFIGCCIVGVWIGVLCRRLESRFFFSRACYAVATRALCGDMVC